MIKKLTDITSPHKKISRKNNKAVKIMIKI